MKICHFSFLITVFFSSVILHGCGFVSQQMHNKVMEEQLLKPGALDPSITATPYYVTHTFNLLGQYQVTHEWPGIAKGCRYTPYLGKPSGLPIKIFDSIGEIVEVDRHVYYIPDIRYADPKALFTGRSIDRFVLGEYESHSSKGVIRKEQGFEPMCSQAWVRSHQGIGVALRKQTKAEWMAILQQSPTRKISNQRIGENDWLHEQFSLLPTHDNGSWDIYQRWYLPIGDTGFSLIILHSASLDTLTHSADFSQMQVIVRHLIESVKIEPFSEAQ